MTDTREVKDEKPCRGCREMIHGQALVCPFCRTPQKISTTAAALNVLKWLGGITALVSLVLATSQVYYLFSGYREKQALLEELVAAAQIQSDSGDYEQALSLLEEARTLDPVNRKARKARVDLAMEYIRTRPYWHKRTPDTVKRLLPDLVRSVSAFSGQKSSDINAHIAWAYILLAESGAGKFSVDPYLEKALDLDPENMFAHAFKGYWNLSASNGTGNKGVDEGARIRQSLSHFNQALKTGRERDFVRKLEIRSLAEFSGPPEQRLELFRLVISLHREGEMPDKASRYKLIEFFDCFMYDHDSAAVLSNLALSRLDPRQLLAAFQWLYQKDPDIHIPGNVDFERYHFVSAVLTRGAGDQTLALALFRQLFQKLRGSSMYRDALFREVKIITRQNPD